MSAQRLNNEKFRDLLLYISDKNRDNPRFGAIVLNKMFYYADFGWYAMTGQSITGDTYVRREQGPVPKHLVPVREELKSEGLIRIEKVKYFGRDQNRLTPTEKFSGTTALSEDEIAFVDSIIDQLSPLNGQQVSDMTHRELSWNILPDGEEVPYETFFLRYINPIPRDTMNWAKEVVKKRRLAGIAAT